MAGRPTSGTRAALPHAPAVSAAEEQLRACPSSGAAAPGPGRQTTARLGSRERPPVTHAGHTHQVRSCSQRGRHQESRLERPGPMSRGQMAGTRPSTRSSEVPSSEASFGSHRPKEDLGTVEQGKPRSAGSRAPGSEARRRAGAGAMRPSDRPSVSRGSVSQYGTVPHINIGSLIFLA